MTVKNVGRQFCGTSKLLFRDNNFQSSQARQIAALGFNQSQTAPFAVNAPENQGPWYFSAIADYGNAVKERNETNNVRNFYQY